MLPSYSKATAALVHRLLAEQPVPGARADAVVVYVRAQQRAMPDYLRAPMRLLTLLFDAAGLRRGRPFHALAGGEQQRQLERWRRSRLRARRELVMFYERLTAFGDAALARSGEGD